jgi:hypothetical protein
MTPEKFETILEKQVPDDMKRRLANYVIDSLTKEGKKYQIQQLLHNIKR